MFLLFSEARQNNHDQLDQKIGIFTGQCNKHELMVQLQEAGVPAGAVLKAPEVLDNPQVKTRDYFVELGGDHIKKSDIPARRYGLMDNVGLTGIVHRNSANTMRRSSVNCWV